jgi:diketogulonate reductase-like aldo/keto reductase
MKRRALLLSLAAAPVLPAAAAVITRPIPVSGELLPAIGMGSWLTFDVGDSRVERAARHRVLAAFFAAGGGMIDSSPMYGRAERLLGELLRDRQASPAPGARLFRATKVWTAFDRVGPTQMDESARLWGAETGAGFDLMQVHNLLNWRAHWPRLREGQRAGRFRYIGFSTSHGRRHDELLAILAAERPDFIQITLNLADRSAEPVIARAAERGAAVIINRPFDGGLLFNRVGQTPLPAVGRDLGCTHWAQFFLLWVLSQPGVTVAIPATSQPAHMEQNMATLRLPLPTPAQRLRMSQAFEAL